MPDSLWSVDDRWQEFHHFTVEAGLRLKENLRAVGAAGWPKEPPPDSIRPDRG